MYFAGPPIWLLLAPVYLLIVVIVAVIWAIARFRARKRSNNLPSCRRCGYVVIGLDRGVCPECGAHLTDARAIVRPDTIGIRTALKRLTVFTLLASYPALVAGIVLAELSIWPNLCGSGANASLSQPASQAYDAVQIHVACDDVRNVHRTGMATFQVDRRSQTPGIAVPSRPWEIELPSMRWRVQQVRSPLPWSRQPIDADTLATLLVDSSFQGDRQALIAEACCILDTIGAMGGQSHDQSTTVTDSPTGILPQQHLSDETIALSSSSAPFKNVITGRFKVYCENPWWVPWVIAAFELFLWLIIAAFIIFGARQKALRNRLAMQHAIESMAPSSRADSRSPIADR